MRSEVEEFTFFVLRLWERSVFLSVSTKMREDPSEFYL
jgi:hypothetical protein